MLSRLLSHFKRKILFLWRYTAWLQRGLNLLNHYLFFSASRRKAKMGNVTKEKFYGRRLFHFFWITFFLLFYSIFFYIFLASTFDNNPEPQFIVWFLPGKNQGCIAFVIRFHTKYLPFVCNFFSSPERYKNPVSSCHFLSLLLLSVVIALFSFFPFSPR